MISTVAHGDSEFSSLVETVVLSTSYRAAGPNAVDASKVHDLTNSARDRKVFVPRTPLLLTSQARQHAHAGKSSLPRVKRADGTKLRAVKSLELKVI